MSVILETKQLCKFYGAGENQVNITVRRSRQSGVARATCPD